MEFNQLIQDRNIKGKYLVFSKEKTVDKSHIGK